MTGAELWLFAVIAPVTAYLAGAVTGWAFRGRRQAATLEAAATLESDVPEWVWPAPPADPNCLGCAEGRGRHSIDCSAVASVTPIRPGAA